MEKKELTRNYIILVVICIGLFAGGFIAGCNSGRSADSQRGNITDSGRDAEYSRQAGLAAELIGELDEGLGRVSEGLSEIAADIGSNASDIRVLEQRLRKAAVRVKDNENYNNYLRGRIRDYYNSIDNSSD